MDLRGYVEHTLLRADATPGDLERHCDEAAAHGLVGVCVSPLYVGRARERLSGASTRVITVVGFPLGTSTSASKAAEARAAVRDGADELDMVMAVGLASAGNWGDVESDVRAVRDATRGRVLKVILETGLLSHAQIRKAAEVVVSAGADFVKTSTGYGPRGASVADVRLLAAAIGDRARVKASGGIRTAAFARELVVAGASRVGTSNGVAIALARD
jgi:deoxyribose-phosphate aldolase